MKALNKLGNLTLCTNIGTLVRVTRLNESWATKATFIQGGFAMTANQINYWKLQEEQRTNRANEALKGQDIGVKKDYNEKSISLEKEKLAETARANIAREDEAKRHNQQTETIQAAKVVVDGTTSIIKGLI